MHCVCQCLINEHTTTTTTTTTTKILGEERLQGQVARPKAEARGTKSQECLVAMYFLFIVYAYVHGSA